MSGRRRRAPDRFALAAVASAAVHAAALAAALLWFGRTPPRPPAVEQGVEIVWDDTSGEAVGEDPAEAAEPGAPPSAPAPEAVQAPEAPRMAEAPPTPIAEPTDVPAPPQPPAPPAPPAAPTLAEAPPAPAAAPDLPPLEVPEPDIAALPPVPEAAPSSVTEIPAPPPPPPPPHPAAPRAEPRPPAQATRQGEGQAVRSAPGIGRATGAVVPPGLDSSFRNAAPAYPEASRLRGEQGAVGLELSIDAQGRVVSAVVARSSGSPALDAAARSAVLAWRFRPARVDGQPVPGAIRTTVHFRLS